jgi:hypothetical protein
MVNSIEKALEETWAMKEKFYEDNKNLSTIEILRKLDNKYKNMEYGAQHITNGNCSAAYPAAPGST